MHAPVTLLVDNGSLEPAATGRLRELAAALAEKIGAPVAPVSMLHADGVPAELLDGQPARTLERALGEGLAGGARDFVIVPLFFGPSRALTVFLPRVVATARRGHPGLRVRVAAPLFAAGDDRLARILADHVRAMDSRAARVALVDHGSPQREVTAVRAALAEQLQVLLGPATSVVACSMERRPGPAYAFNEPLLAQVLARPEWVGEIVVALQFLLPGRHAGPAGDIARICQRAAVARPELRLHRTPLVGAHPGLSEILADRWRTAATEI